MKKQILAIAFGLLIASNSFAQDIKIAAAANVGAVMDDIKAAFAKKYPNDKLDVTLGASGNFAAQIQNGAPYQVFVSADVGFPQKLQAAGFTASEPKIYASGVLAMLTTKPLDLNKKLSVLTEANVQKIAIANPKTAPYGKAAVEAMTATGIYDKVATKIVQADSITQAYQYTVTAADVGFVALSSLTAGDGLKYKENVNWIIVDEKLYKPLEQAVVLLKNGEKSSASKAFVEFLLSADAKAIFKKHGYK